MKHKLIYSKIISVKSGDTTTQYEVAFRKLGRSKYEEADIFYTKTFHEKIAQGVLPKIMVQKSLLDMGGVVKQEYATKREEILTKIHELEEKLSSLIGENDTAEKTEIIAELQVLENQYEEYDFERFNMADYTAESFANNETVRWIALYGAMIRKVSEPPVEFEPLFKGETYKDQLADFDKKEDDEDPIYLSALKYIYLVAHFVRRGIQDKEIIQKEIDSRIKEADVENATVEAEKADKAAEAPVGEQA